MGPIDIDFHALFTGLIVVGALIGGAITLVLVWLLPWLWSFIKPWLHAVTG